ETIMAALPLTPDSCLLTPVSSRGTPDSCLLTPVSSRGTPDSCLLTPVSSRGHSRSAFTLIELLVVVILFVILAGIAATFLPAIGETARQAQAGTMLQQWILTAKQRALRDQLPCGLRLFPYVDPNTKKIVGFENVNGKVPVYSTLTGQSLPFPGQVREM